MRQRWYYEGGSIQAGGGSGHASTTSWLSAVDPVVVGGVLALAVTAVLLGWALLHLARQPKPVRVYRSHKN